MEANISFVDERAWRNNGPLRVLLENGPISIFVAWLNLYRISADAYLLEGTALPKVRAISPRTRAEGRQAS